MTTYSLHNKQGDRLPPELDEESFAQLLNALGDKASVLHGLEVNSAGGDLDCAVDRIDPLWVLHYQGGWRLCQCLRYDLTGRTWILIKDGKALEVDSLDDPLGIGRYGFSTDLILDEIAPDSLNAIRAAYLVAKRLRKGDQSEPSWRMIDDLAQSDVEAFERALGTIFGVRTGRALADRIGPLREPGLWRTARIAQFARRFRTPKRASIAAVTAVGRVIERVSRPTGLFVVVVGPDGAGKSTLCEALEDACHPLFRRYRRFHWRPRFLPQAGALVGRKLMDSSRPHEIRPRARLLSPLVVAYYWLDFFLGGWGRMWPLKLRSTMVILERGWKDLLVDPKRYGFRRVPKRIVDAAAWVLPTPDLVFVLEGVSEALAARKNELSPEETERQNIAWREVFKDDPRAVFLDATDQQRAVAATGRGHIVDFLERRTLSGLGPGWVSLPTRRNPRWLLPRGRSRVAARGVKLYQPVTQRGRIGWEAARLSARLGAFRALRRASAPSKDILDLVMPYVPKRGNFALGRCNHPARFVALVLDEDGQTRCFAKIALEEEGRGALLKEGERIEAVGERLPSPLLPPSIIAREDGILVLEAVQWQPRAFPWVLPEAVASALGVLFRVDSRAISQTHGWAHGDCAPWNLLKRGQEWVLVDWEYAREDAPPFFDIFHYIVQAHSLLSRPSRSAVLESIEGDGSLGRVVRAYCDAAKVDLKQARDEFPPYLETTEAMMDPGTPDGRRAIRVRRALLGMVGRG